MPNLQQKIWNAARVLKVFNIEEIQHSNGSKNAIRYDTVRVYLLLLERSGYIVSLDNARFKLIKNTGKLSPILRIETLNGTLVKKSIFDRNTGEYMPLATSTIKKGKGNVFKERLSKILEHLKDKNEFRLQDVTEIISSYEKAKADLFTLQKQGYVIWLRNEYGESARHKGKKAVVSVYSVVSNKVYYKDLIDDINIFVIKPQFAKLEKQISSLYELTNDLNNVQSAKHYEEILETYSKVVDAETIKNLELYGKEFKEKELTK